MTSRIALDRAVFAGALALVCAACGGSDSVTTTSAQVPSRASQRGNVQVSAMLRERCAIDPARVSVPPRFAFDAAEILEADRAVLDQLVACVTEGPQQGHRLALVGRADPASAGPTVIHPGSEHADAVAQYLQLSGVAAAQLAESPREDGAGTSAEDRRVDIDAR